MIPSKIKLLLFDYARHIVVRVNHSLTKMQALQNVELYLHGDTFVSLRNVSSAQQVAKFLQCVLRKYSLKEGDGPLPSR